MSTNDFPRFRDLPTELRLKVWSFCIPGRRVYEMDAPLSDNHVTFPAGADRPRELWSSPSGRIPVISRVCREAREAVLKCHLYMTGEEAQTDEDGASYPRWSTWNVNLPVRLRKGFDVVHLHWHRSYDHHVWLPAAPNPLPSFRWLANQAAAASVSTELLHPFDRDQDNIFFPITTIGHKEVKCFSPHVLYYVVLAIVEIHMSDYEAAQAQVFGALGEEPIKLVDPRDTATVVRFRDAWRCHRLPSEEPDLAEFFSRTTDSAEAYYASVEQWCQDLEKVWMWHKCIELSVRDDARAEIWPDPNRPTGGAPMGTDAAGANAAL
ncbi:hypothetical protein DL764_006690 [Monosporascus ibericus]|uniref:2EXR domain-containing protein n=1 Tax=Monosporascus ibericus TaxID=155417 RepID=A0A4Q4T7S2_9PEZI|nr:hypothetical protein DL764_006690 [Monosporascus ibericus]